MIKFFNSRKIRASVVMGDITTLNVDVIVNAANTSLLGGGGVDGAIHKAAGPYLLEACKLLDGCETGEVKDTDAYNIPVNRIIHTPGPVYEDYKPKEAKQLLINCYRNSIRRMRMMGYKTIAFPNISTGVYGFPKELAADIAIKVIKQNIRSDEYATFICFDVDNYKIYQTKLSGKSKKYFNDILEKDIKEDSLEKLFCEPFNQLPVHEMSEDLFKALANLMMAKDHDIHDDIKKEFLYQVIEKRVEHCFTFKILDKKLIIFLMFLSESPGRAVMYLTYLQWWCKKNDVRELTLTIFGEKIFPMGFPSKLDLSNLWVKTKVSTKHRFDNLVDYQSALKSIHFED